MTYCLVLGAFLLLFSLKTWRTSSSLIFSADLGARGVAVGVNVCGEVFRAVVGIFPSLQ